MNIISEFGIKIKNIEAATIYEYNIGLRDHYEYKNAMLVNSLFKDFMVENGLSVSKGEATRDIIGIEFNYGTREYKKELEHIRKIAQNARAEYKAALGTGLTVPIEKAERKKKRLQNVYKRAITMKDKYKKMSKDDIRHMFYKDGIDITYTYKDRKTGEMVEDETIHYKMLFRSTGKAKKGSCMFIREELYDRAIDFLYMGIKLPEKNAQIVEISAYAPLVASGIVGKVRIDPRNILILKDVDRFMTRNVVSIETDKKKQCHAINREDYTLKNTMFDGQALIDSSLFPEWGDGYVLLRHHFCKMAAFCTHIQKFFKDYYGDKYETATVTDMFGNEHYVKDIELITTDNAIKWLV